MARGNDRSKRIVASVGAVALAIALVAGAAAVAGAHTARVGVADSDYTLVLDADNTLEDPTTGSGTVYTTAGNPVAFGCTSATATDSACMTLATGGTLYNTDAISGISSISSVADQDLTLEYWWSDETEAITATLLAGGSFKFTDGRPSYFRVTAGTADTLITSLTIKYTCSAEASPDSLSDTTAVGCVIEYDSATGTYVVTSPTSYAVEFVHVPAYYDDGTNGKRPVTALAYARVSIFRGTFYMCHSLTTVELPSTVTTLEQSSFNQCVALSSINIPDSVTTIGVSAFSGCTSLPSIEIPSSVETIGQGAFMGCSSLTSIDIPASVTTIGKGAFGGDGSLETITVDDDNPNYADIDEHLLVTKDGTELIQAAIAGLSTIDIPSTVTQIDQYSFAYFSDLTSIEVPEGVETMEMLVFRECTSLQSVVLPASLTELSDLPFPGCEALSYIEVDDANTVYSTSDDHRLLMDEEQTEIIFIAGEGMTSCTIPATVTTIDNGAFNLCEDLTTVTVEDGSELTTIADNAFATCTALSSATFPDTVTSIGGNAFSGCTSLTEFNIPSSVTSIGNNAFMNCAGLTSITIPDSVTTMGYNVFQNCTSLESAELSSSATTVPGDTFSGCTALTSISIPASVTSIGGSAFYNCSGLTSVTFEGTSSVASIGSKTFYGCTSLTSITLPGTLTDLGSAAFSGCTSLSSINFSGTQAQWGKIGITTGTFSGVATTYVQCTDGRAGISNT
jgi:hypothetical protein